MLHSRWSTFAMIFLWTRVCQRLETEYVATALVVTRSAGTGGTHSRRLALDGAARKLSDSLPWTSSPRPTPTVLHAAPVKITPRTRSNFHRTPRRVSTRRHSLPLSPFASSGSSSIYTQLFSSQKPMSSLSTASTSSTTTFTDTELTEVKRDFQSATELYRKNLASTTKLPALQSRIADLETEQSQPDFWDEPNTSRAAIVNAQVSTATRLLTRIQAWQEWHGDAQAALEILSQSWTASSDDATAVTSGLNNSLRLASEERAMLLDEFRSAIARLREDSERFELELLLSGPYDHAPARLLLTAGAGGTEANDWVGDLKRMYQRHCEAMGLSCVVQDEQAGEAVGYKSVELLVSGENAYGWLQGEKGAHRMVRLSPFNANNKRQTTFAGVDVAPDILNQDDDAYWNTIDVPESELEITTMRAGGKGGQNVNKVNSAVRIKHLPSGLQVKCAQERSQSMNKNIALKRLKAQLLAIVQEQRVAEIKEIRGDMVEASWGAQIRNYVFHPYKMIKDQRTGWETSNVQAFMDGDLLEECIGSFLRHKAEEQRKEQIANELSRVKDYMFLVEKTKRERQEKAVQQKLDAKLEHERQQQEVEDRQRRAEEKVTREQQRNTYGKRDRVCEKMASASFESLESEQKSSIVWADTFDVNLDVEVLCTNLDLTGLQSLAQELENITCPKESLTMIHQEVLVAKQRETDGDFSNGEQSNDKSPTVTPALKLNLWTKEELSALAKAVKKYPPGGSSRWEQIALFVNNLCKEDELRSTEECIEKYNNMAKTHSKATESTNGVAAASEPENSSQSNEDVWTAEQDQQLQDGHAANPASMGKKSGGPQLQSVSGKSKKQCAQRFKVIRDSFTTVNG